MIYRFEHSINIFSSEQNLAGFKVTAIDKTNIMCFRGGKNILISAKLKQLPQIGERIIVHGYEFVEDIRIFKEI